MRDWSIEAEGTQALLIRFSGHISINQAIIIRAARDRIAAAFASAITDIVPSYTTLTIHYHSQMHDFQSLSRQIAPLLQNLESTPAATEREIEIPVWYDQQVGPDLPRVAERHGISIQQVVERHCSRAYYVYALGFAPGFAYLGDVADNLATPRLATPRAKVAAGSVALADRQTAVYPIDTPGGWNILGRTPLQMFDRELDELCPVSAGDRVRFVPISRECFIAAGGKI